MTEVTVSVDQVQEQVQIDTGLDASDIENVIILPMPVQTWKYQK